MCARRAGMTTIIHQGLWEKKANKKERKSWIDSWKSWRVIPMLILPDKTPIPTKKSFTRTKTKSSHPPSINQIWINKFWKNTKKLSSHKLQMKWNWKKPQSPPPSLSTLRLWSLMSRMSTIKRSSISSKSLLWMLKLIIMHPLKIFHSSNCWKQAVKHSNKSWTRILRSKPRKSHRRKKMVRQASQPQAKKPQLP